MGIFGFVKSVVKPTKTRYDRNGNPTSDRYTVNKDGNMNKWGRDKIRREGPAPRNNVPKKDKTRV